MRQGESQWKLPGSGGPKGGPNYVAYVFVFLCSIVIYQLYRIIKNDCWGFNNLSYTIHLRQEYIVAPMDQEILKVFFYDVRCAEFLN